MKKLLSIAAQEALNLTIAFEAKTERRNCDKVFLTLLLSILCFSSFLTVTAAEQVPVHYLNFNDAVDPLEITTEQAYKFTLLKDIIESLGKDNQDPIPFVPNDYLTRESFERLVAFTNQEEQAGRDVFLNHLTSGQLISFVKIANFFDISNETDAYTNLVEYVLHRLNEAELKSLFFIATADENGAIHYTPLENSFLDYEATQKALKKIKCTLAQDAKSNMITSKKIKLLQELGLWHLSIQDIYDNEATKILVTKMNHDSEGHAILRLSCLSLTSLEGFEHTPFKDAVTIDLSYNLLTTLHHDVFGKPSSKPKRLRLDHNQLTTITRDTFSSLRSLYMISLDHNQLVTITSDTFSNVPRLSELTLSNNLITTITKDTFSNLPSLRELFLKNNRIDRLTADAFDNLPDLYHLDMKNNQLTSLDPLTFANTPRLFTVYLENNNFSDEQKEIVRQNVPRDCKVQF